MKIKYDSEADALYIELHPLGKGDAQCRNLTDEIIADYDKNGKLAGIEILEASLVLGEEPQRLILESLQTSKSA